MLSETPGKKQAQFVVTPNPEIYRWQSNLKVINLSAKEFKVPGENLNSGQWNPRLTLYTYRVLLFAVKIILISAAFRYT